MLISPVDVIAMLSVASAHLPQAAVLARGQWAPNAHVGSRQAALEAEWGAVGLGALRLGGGR